MENVDDYEATKSLIWMLARIQCVAANARRRRRVIDKIGSLFLLRAREPLASQYSSWHSCFSRWNSFYSCS